MSARESHQIGAAPVAVLQLTEEVGHPGAGVGNPERGAENLSTRGEGHADHVALDFNARRSVRKQNTHKTPPQFKVKPAVRRAARNSVLALGAADLGGRQVNSIYNCSRSEGPGEPLNNPRVFPPALSLKAQTQAARSILHRPPGRAATLSRESAPKTHRGPVAADFGGVKGMEGARLQSARAPRFAPLAGRRPTEQRRFVRLLAGPHQSGAVVGGIQRPLPVPHTMRSAVRLLCSKAVRGFRADPIRNQPVRRAA